MRYDRPLSTGGAVTHAINGRTSGAQWAQEPQEAHVELETGLRGVEVGYCVTSSLSPLTGVSYRGIPIAELSHRTPEEVIYLLQHGRLGSEEEVCVFFDSLRPYARCSDASCALIAHLPRSISPMRMLSIALNALEGTQDYAHDYLRVIAQLPHMVATIINHHAGWGETPEPDPSLGYMENFAHMLRPPEGMHPQSASVLQLFNILHYDHEGGNLSTFTGKAVASGLEDLYGSLAAAMNALNGPRHGGASEESLRLLREMRCTLGPEPTLEKAEAFVRSKLQKKELIYGFGHAILRVEDPRATVLYRYAHTHLANDPLVQAALTLRKAAPLVLRERPQISNPYPNVDAISGAVLQAVFPYPEYSTLLFALSRCVGIGRQIVYERCEARAGRGVPIYRPTYLYRPLGSGGTS
jgi:citrate synthase